MRALDDPAAGAETSVTLERLLLFTAGADVAGEAEFGDQLVHLWVLVALVQTQAVPALLADVRPLDHDALERRAQQLEVVHVRARDLEPDRDAAAFADKRALRPLLALSVGLGPVAAPPSGALPIAPSQDSHSHSIPFTRS